MTRSLETFADLKRKSLLRPTFTDPRDVDFLGAIPRLSPQLNRPHWLTPLVDVLRRMFLASAGLGPPVRATCSVPSQHGKTFTIQHALACWLQHRPQDALIYCTYNEDLAREKSRETRDLAKLAGVELREDSNSLGTWTTPAGGGLRSRAIVGGALTGTPGLRGIIIDDPYKNRQQAESGAWRRDVWTSFTSSIMSRLHRQTSILVNHTRWVEGDLIGRIKKEFATPLPDVPVWEHINLPAINDKGEALWPEGQPLSLLAEKRAASEYDWWAVYMGQPRSKDGKLFRGVQYFTETPAHLRVAIGVDLAYTDDTSSDWSVAVVLGESSGRYYVLEVVRKQCQAPVFALELKRLGEKYPGAPMRKFGNATERGSVDFIRREGVPLGFELATTDKYVRAQPFAAAWSGAEEPGPPGQPPRVVIPPRVYVRQGASWTADYLDVMSEATGLGGELDDDVDASSAAYSLLPSTWQPAQTFFEPPPPRPKRDPALVARGRGKLGTW